MANCARCFATVRWSMNITFHQINYSFLPSQVLLASCQTLLPGQVLGLVIVDDAMFLVNRSDRGFGFVVDDSCITVRSPTLLARKAFLSTFISRR